MISRSDVDLARAADVLDGLAQHVEDAAVSRDLSPAEVARAAGVPVRSVLALVDGPVSHTTAARLLRWLETTR